MSNHLSIMHKFCAKFSCASKVIFGSMLFASLLPLLAAAEEFAKPDPYPQHAADINIADYRARAVDAGIRLRWDGEQFRDAAGKRYTPPAWFSAGFPDQDIDGIMGAGALDENAIGRILRATAADDGWRRLSFTALDLPDADGGFDQRQQQLAEIISSAQLPNLKGTAWEVFIRPEALQKALAAMYKTGGNGYLLHHKDAAYGAGGSDLLLALPYELGEAVVTAHRPGKGEYTGMLGSLEVADSEGGRFIIGTGFTRAQRLSPPPLDARIEYKYKGYTGTGKPKNPVFLRTLATAAAENKIGGIVRSIHLTWFFIALMLLLAAMDAATHTRGGRRWNFKSAIVSTGLLGTFVGVFWGLYNFNTADIAAGVPALLDGLKLAFVTSIVGIALSTVLSVVQTILGSAD